MKIEYDYYIAGPLYSRAEKSFNLRLFYKLPGVKVFLPQRLSDDGSSSFIFESLIDALNDSSGLILIGEGADIDAGASWEHGYFYGRYPERRDNIYMLRTDFGEWGYGEGRSLMTCHSISKRFSNADALTGHILNSKGE